MQNILLIVPPNIALNDMIISEGKFSAKIRRELPIGVVSIATYLKAICHIKVKILDLNLLFSKILENETVDENRIEQEIQQALKCFQNEVFDVIGISVIFSPAFSYMNPIGKAVKELFPDSMYVAGGGVPTSAYKTVFSHVPYLDAVCYGEGELPFKELVESADATSYLENSLSWITREKLENDINYEFLFIEDLDEIPTMDYSLIEFKEYSSHAHKQNNQELISVPLMFSRGCPFDCCFCASHSVHGKKVRYNSLERIKHDISVFVEKYGVNTIVVWDDNFFVDKDQALALLDYFTEQNLDVEFVNGFPVYRMDDDMAAKLKSSGVEVVTLAIESGNARVLKDIIHKPLKLDMVEKAISCIRKYDMYIKGLFVIGFPGETLADINETMDFIHRIDLNWVDIFIASPIVGSELFEICETRGYLKNTDMDICNYWKGNIETEHFTAKQIEELQVYHVIKKDYINNYDMLHGNWERALINFEYVINAKHENPFAYFYAAQAAKKIGNDKKARQYGLKASEIFSGNAEWKEMQKQFELELTSM